MFKRQISASPLPRILVVIQAEIPVAAVPVEETAAAAVPAAVMAETAAPMAEIRAVPAAVTQETVRIWSGRMIICNI